MIAIASLLALATVSAFVPYLRSIGVPDQSWISSAGWLPVVFLVLYTWTPSPKLLAKACAMSVIAAIGNAAVILAISVLAKPPEDPGFAYAWAAAPFAFAACYIGYAAWVDRNQHVTHPMASLTGG
jgi:hypothetical protein